jgi:hypothetical protein
MQNVCRTLLHSVDKFGYLVREGSIDFMALRRAQELRYLKIKVA